jgi:hypothetical protein
MIERQRGSGGMTPRRVGWLASIAGVATAALLAAGVAVAARRWMATAEVPPRELARRKWRRARAMAARRTNAD